MLTLLSLASWLYLVLLHGGFWRTGPFLSEDVGNLDEWPPVVAIVPARDEAHVIVRTLSALRHQRYPGGFVIVLVDDDSRDETVALSCRVASGSGPAVDIIHGRPLPAGWTGKLWAMAQGVERAVQAMPDARYFWFADADLEHDPQALRDLVWQAESRSLDLVSTMALLHCANFWERLLIPAFVFYFRKLYPFRLVNSLRNSIAAAAGGSMLVRVEALQRPGGLAAIRGELIDDCALARLLKPGGGIWLGLTLHSRSIREYSLGGIWRMVARSAYCQLRYSPFRLLTAVAGLALLYMIPVIGLVHGLLSHQLVAATLGGAAWALMALAYLPLVRFYRQPGLMALLLPAAALLYTLMTIDSARRHRQGRGGMWKGRVQSPVD